MFDHIHLCLSIPPKLSVAYTIGMLEGKSAVRIHRDYVGAERSTNIAVDPDAHCIDPTAGNA